MTSDEIKQHLYVAMQEKSDYDKALKIIRVFNESLKDAIESGIMLKMLYYQWSGAITKLNKKTDWNIPENLFVFIVKKMDIDSRMIKIMGWNNTSFERHSIFDSIELVIKTYLEINSNSTDNTAPAI